MLSRTYRLQKKDIERLHRKGSTRRLSSLMARFITNRTNHARFAVVIPKKTLAKATDRNRARRLIYEFLKTQDAWAGSHHLDVAFFLRGSNDKTMGEVSQILESLK